MGNTQSSVSGQPGKEPPEQDPNQDGNNQDDDSQANQPLRRQRRVRRKGKWVITDFSVKRVRRGRNWTPGQVARNNSASSSSRRIIGQPKVKRMRNQVSASAKTSSNGTSGPETPITEGGEALPIDDQPLIPWASTGSCGICLEAFSASELKVVSTVCGHLFHQYCLKDSLQNQKYCPSCRKKMGKRSYHAIYF